MRPSHSSLVLGDAIVPSVASRQGANLTRLGTLRQSEEIIVPVSIRVGSQVLPATIAGIHDTDVGPMSRRIDDEEGVRPVFDAGNYVLGGPLPTASANMGDPVVGTIPVWLRYAGDLNVCHVVLQEGSPNSGFRTRRGGVTSTAAGARSMKDVRVRVLALSRRRRT